MATISISLGPVTVNKTISAGNTTRVQNYAVARFSAVQPGITATEAVNLLAAAMIDGLRADVMEWERQQAVQAVTANPLPVT